MNICDANGHGEIVHEGSRCPACKRIEELETQIEAEKDATARMERELNDVQAELDSCESDGK